MAGSKIGALQVGRRAMVVCAALIVRPDSDIYTPQELAHRTVSMDHGNGTAYAALQMLEGAMPRSAVVTVPAVTSPAERFAGAEHQRAAACSFPGESLVAAQSVGASWLR